MFRSTTLVVPYIVLLHKAYCSISNLCVLFHKKLAFYPQHERGKAEKLIPTVVVKRDYYKKRNKNKKLKS
jgi:hypothetical protein